MSNRAGYQCRLADGELGSSLRFILSSYTHLADHVQRDCPCGQRWHALPFVHKRHTS